MANHYQTLGLSNFASPSEIQKAFRGLALKYHPDRHGGSKIHENKFKEINAAYQILSNPTSKARYDDLLHFGQQKSVKPHQTTYYHNINKEKGEPNKYKIKKEPILNYSAFQKVYIKVALITLGLFVFCGITANLLSKKENPINVFSQNESSLLIKERNAIDKVELPLAISLKDSLTLLNIDYGTQVTLEQKILSLVLEKGNEAYRLAKYKASLESFLLLDSLSLAYGFQLRSQNKIRIIELFFNCDEKAEAIEKVEEINNLEIEKYDDAFYLAQVLLKNEEFKLAFNTLDKYYPKFLYDMQSKYGASYNNILETGEIHPSVIPALFQYVCLGNTYTDKNLEFHQDLLKNMIREPNQKYLFQLFYFNKFDKKKITESTELIEYESLLDQLYLNRFYESLK